jgi:outer membrane protein OmpA-like peptidoglycan-associated protein
MGEPSVLRKDDGVRQGDEDPGGADLASLRSLLLAPEQQHLAALQARLDDTQARAEDLADVLPHVLLQHAQDPHFTRALTPPIEKAITESVHRNPQPLADALFPIMGPAIRQAVAAGLAGMVESLNRTLEHSLSWRSIQWRLEGWRTGKSFAEVLLLKTLVYRVEQVFLIDRKSGLLLQHVHADSADVQDADMVSGMLTAIRDFVQDSFGTKSGDSLEALKVGDLSVWIEPGPYAIVAAVIRGAAPREFRRTLQDTVESLHLQFGEALASFQGDTTAFADAQSPLRACLEMKYRADEAHPKSRGAWLLFSAALVGLLVWAGFRYRDYQRWTHYLDLLRAEPGIVIVSTGHEAGARMVSGLRDPLARDPREFIAQTQLGASDVVGHWAPYHALDPLLVLARANAVLRPPVGTTLALENGVLTAAGNPPLNWVIDSSRMAPVVSGVTSFDVPRTLAPVLQTTTAAIESRELLFFRGTVALADGQADTLTALVDDVRRLDDLAAATGTRFRLDVVGHTDSEGPDEANLPLSLQRAQIVADALPTTSSPRFDVSASGVGSAQPAVNSQDEAANLRNRRVVVRVTPLDGRQ